MTETLNIAETPETTQNIKTHFDNQIDAFYQHLFKSLKLYLSDTPPVNVQGKLYYNFIEYWTYVLYRDYGVKRKIHKYGETPESEYENDLDRKIFGVNKKLLLQLYYNKNSNGYDKSKLLNDPECIFFNASV